MALITRFRQVEKSRATLHEPVTCRPVRLAVASGWSILDTPGGRVLQLDTYGSEERELQGKVSQSIQIDEVGAREVLRLVQQAFPELE